MYLVRAVLCDLVVTDDSRLRGASGANYQITGKCEHGCRRQTPDKPAAKRPALRRENLGRGLRNQDRNALRHGLSLKAGRVAGAVGACSRFYANICRELVASPRHCDDGLRTFRKHLAQLPDMLREIPLIHKGVWPDGLEQLILGNYSSGVGHQIGQHLKRLRGNGNSGPRARQ